MAQEHLIVFFRLLLAALLGGIIGLERESLNRPAGLRTHTIVSLGAALIMQVSLSLTGGDPGRIAAQVISGIGFLGAGTILREGSSVRGLTTAASLWVVAGIGLAVGSGLYLAAVVASVLVVFTLAGLGRLEKPFSGSARHHAFQVEIMDRPGQLGRLATALGQMNVHIRGIELKQLPDKGTVMVEMMVQLPHSGDKDDVMTKLMAVEGVYSIQDL
ncbi:MAG TPA: MgtC/SapB family protein [Firmicutes bacterium]|nr:MgtC/SapB family protein [Bacillota bacterium]